MLQQNIQGSAGRPAPILLRVLILEDNPLDANLCLQELKKAGFDTQADLVDTEDSFADKLRCGVYDLILSDFRIPGWSGVEAFRVLAQSGRDIPFILITGTLGEEAAVDLIKEGITDYILKDRLVRLPLAVDRALQEKVCATNASESINHLLKARSRSGCYSNPPLRPSMALTSTGTALL